ncbi:MAG: hypothetical protein ACE145_21695 [Terriglobia bacterium]
MKRTILLTTSLGVLLMGSIPLFAQRGGGGGRPGGAGGGPGSGGMGAGASADRGAMGRPDNTGMSGDRRMSGMDHGRNGDMSTGQKSPGELLTQNTKLSSKLQTLLPAGTDLQQASAGFKNLGEFVAAVHVSQNLNIPFDQLKAKMTGPDAMNLGKAIHDLRPDVKAKAEAKRAKKQAKQEIAETQKEVAS